MADSVLSVQDMLSRSLNNVVAGKTTANMSAVEKLLASRGTPLPTDTVQLSPVQKILQAEDNAATKKEDYFKSDAYLKLKVNQLRQQLSIYSTLPGLDPSGSIMKSIEAEIKDLYSKQQESLKQTQEQAAAKQAELSQKQAQAQADAAVPSADDMLAKVQGKQTTEPLSREVQALLDSVKGSTVNTTA